MRVETHPFLKIYIYIYILGKKVKKILLYMLRLLTMAAQNVSGMNKIVFVDTINDGIDQSENYDIVTNDRFCTKCTMSSNPIQPIRSV